MSSLQIMSYNIRYNTPADGVNAWPNRKARVAQLLNTHKADVMGFQEVLVDQLEDLRVSLPDYNYVGVGRDDGRSKGEYAPVFYLKAKLELLGQGTFWLSETPDVPSRGWDAALPRICTWAKLRHLKTSRVFYHFNTHFDHVGALARANSATLLLKKIGAIAADNPTILTGDFNAEPGSQPYKTLTATLSDTSETAKNRAGGVVTCPGFQVGRSGGVKIDYIFASKHLTPKSYATLNSSWQGYYLSDHLPLLVGATFLEERAALY